MRLLRLVPGRTTFGFMRLRFYAFAFTTVLTVLCLGSVALQGLNLGLDFLGGTLIEARGSGPVDLAPLRQKVDALGLGDVALQTFGEPDTVLIRVQSQAGGTESNSAVVTRVREALGAGFDIRRSEYVGPQVSDELLVSGITAALLSVLVIAVYVWFRFEWQFGLSALITTLHDVVVVFGLFSLFHLEFNLMVVAAILTVAGYSINDTVVVFDRLRETMRRQKTMPMADLIDLAINDTLSRTLMTSGTTMLAALSLLFFGGPVLREFAAAMTVGIVIGTYSSIFVAAAMLIHLPSLRRGEARSADTQAVPAA